jgi:type VI secretion system protein ImpM
MAEESMLGYFGKIPSCGDFVSLRLPRTFVQPWDQWLQEGITTSQGVLGERWLSTYLTSPLWRFVLSPKVCGDLAWAGVLLPSVDRVGRYFPFTVALSLHSTHDVAQFAVQQTAWYAEVEQLALSALDPQLDAAGFETRLRSIAVPVSADVATSGGNAPRVEPQQGPRLFQLATPTNLATGVAALADSLMHEHCACYSLWWTEGSDIVPPCLLACPGLPSRHSYSTLLDGDNTRWQSKTSERADEPNSPCARATGGGAV